MPTIPAPRRRLSHADRGAGRRSPRRPVRRAVRAACRVLAWCAVAVIVWLVLPTQYGGHVGTTVVSGHSMEPTYWTGDLVVTWRDAEVSPGDVVVYRVPEGEPGEGLHVVHRVVSVDEAGRFTMLGDNNDEPDMWTPTATDVVGEVVASVPQGGRWMQVLLSPLALALLCGVLVTLAVVTGGADDTDDSDRDDPGPDAGSGPDHADRHTAFPTPRDAPRRGVGPRHGGGVVVRALIPLAATGLAAVGLPLASASSLGAVASTDLTAARVEARPPSSAGTFSVDRRITTDQPASYCADVTVTNTGRSSAAWRVSLDVAAAPWTATRITSQSNVSTESFTPQGTWVVTGVGWNSTLQAGASTTVAYCAERPALPLTDVTTAVTVTSSDASSYCATVTVSTTSTSWVRWRSTISPSTAGLTPAMRLDAQPTNVWNAGTLSFTAATRTWQVQGSGSNAYVRSGQNQTWGYCSPYSTTGPTTTPTVSVRITSESGAGANTQYCAEVTVSTTSSDWVRWRATIGSTTPGLTASKYRLNEPPSSMWNATGISFTGGSRWSGVVEGAAWNRFVKAGSPTTFGFCK